MLPVEQVNAENYIVPKGSERLYHVKQEIKQFNAKTGAKISTPSIQQYGAKVYKSIVERNLRRLGYTIEVLHDPTDWMRANADKLAELKAAKAQAQAQAEQERKEAEKAAMKAEILAELKAAGVIPDAGREESEQQEKADDAEAQEQTEQKRGPGRPKSTNQ